MVKELLIVNLHSSANAGDHALTLESLRQLRAEFPEARITCAYNDTASAEPDVEVASSFFNWMRRRRVDGTVAWTLFAGVWRIAGALLAGLAYRLTGNAPRLWLTSEQIALVRAYAHADLVVSSAGNVFYSSGSGLNLLLNYFGFVYGAWLGKPIATLPQSFGPFRRRWEQWLMGLIGRRATLLLAREPVSARLLEAAGVPLSRRQLVPDVGFAYQERDDEGASRLLARYVPMHVRPPLLGITLLHWGAQNRAFERQAHYEAAVTATIRRLLAESEAHVLLFAQVWGPTAAEDDRVPARRVASELEKSGRVHMVDAELGPALLKGCYAHLDLLLGSRMHSNIFALSVGVPVVAIGYLTKTAGIMEMMGLPEWVIGIDAATDTTLPELTMQAWAQRHRLRAEVQRTVPAIIDGAGRAAGDIRTSLSPVQPGAPGVKE